MYIDSSVSRWLRLELISCIDFQGSFRGASNEANAVEEMKEAAKESFRSSKSTVERSARSAAEAVQRTAEKVKENLSDEEEPRAEL